MSISSEENRPVRVVIVDDNRTIRALIRKELESSALLEVVGEAADPYEAREVIREVDPDVITLDIVMPRMDGLSFLERLMSLHPRPVVIVSSRTTEKSREAGKALALGAIDCIDVGQLQRGAERIDLAEVLLLAAKSDVSPSNPESDSGEPETQDQKKLRWNRKIVVIGSSTGGVDALLTILDGYPADAPPTVIAQHMPEHFLRSFCRRLNDNCAANVRLAEEDSELAQGMVYLAPGGDVHTVLSDDNPYLLKHVCHDGLPDYVPSVDLLFASAVPHAPKTVGVMLTGMGRDGADAMLRMRRGGAHTIVQNKASAIVDGMPGSARKLGAAVEVADLANMSARILSSVQMTRSESMS